MRIGLNIPNELLARVKQLNPEVNVSEVCREALRAYVEAGERAGAAAVAGWTEEHEAVLTEMVAPAPIKPDWAGFALEDARERLRQVTPEQWRMITREYDFLSKQGRDPAGMVDIWSRVKEGGLAHHLSYDQHPEWFEAQFEAGLAAGVSDTAFSDARAEYSRAWLSYMLEVRRLLDERHKEKRDRVMAERAKRLRASPKPEIPPQLTESPVRPEGR